jgi:hypothetical protein
MAPTVRGSLFSYGHANGPVVPQEMAYNIRHLQNPPRHLRARSTGLSRGLQKEFLQKDNVEAMLVKVQSELLDTVKSGYDQLLPSTEKSEHKPSELNDRPNEDLCPREEDDLKDPNIGLAVTICCEEGRHRSVAFIEELARRLAVFKHGDSLSRGWQLSVEVTVKLGISTSPSHHWARTNAQTKLRPSQDKRNDVKRGTDLTRVCNMTTANASHRFTDYYINPFVSGDNIGISMFMFQGPQKLLFLVFFRGGCILQIWSTFHLRRYDGRISGCLLMLPD